MQELQGLMQDYLASAGYGILDSRDGFLVADKMGFGGDRDTLLVWVPPSVRRVEDYKNIERDFLKDFKVQAVQYANARYLLLVPTFEGFSRDFRQVARDLRIRINVPVNVFDAPFKVEEAPQMKSFISALRDTSVIKRRIPQPYSVIQDNKIVSRGDDLLRQLRRELEDHKKPCLRIVVGPAGVGKTILFKSLFTHFYEEFLTHKRARTLFPRPVPLTPEYLRQAGSKRVGSLIESFLKADVATPTSPETFKWMLSRGFLALMFDGLDELYAGDPDFFYEILDLLTLKSGCAQILLCARESLLTSSDSFAEFLQTYSGSQGQEIRVYHLEKWKKESLRAFAWLKLEGRPQLEGQESQKVKGFLNRIESSEPLTALAGLPYYCELLLDQYNEGKLEEYSDEAALIESSISWLLEREVKKGLLSTENLQSRGLEEWLEAAAAEYVESGFVGVSRTDLEEYAYLVLRPDLSPEEMRDTVTTLVQFPFFAPGPEPGTVAFEHELAAELLAAKYLLSRVTPDPSAVGRNMGAQRIDLANSLLVRYMAKNISKYSGALESLTAALRAQVLQGRAFANLLQLYLMAFPAAGCLHSLGALLEGRDLRYLEFRGKDLCGLSFRNSDLSNVIFQDCNMRDVHLEGAQLSGTRFEKMADGSLTGAGFGNLDQFDFIYVGGNRIDELPRAVQWVQKVTGHKEPIPHACPSALQLKSLFLKYIYPDGSGRRDDLKINALLSGRRFPGAATASDCVDACCRFGYLVQVAPHDRFKRASGDKYSQMVLFVRSWRLSTELRQLLGSLCRETKCQHVPSNPLS